MAVIKKFKAVKFKQTHLLGIQDLSFSEVSDILNQAKTFITLNRSASKKTDILRGKTQINLFFEPFGYMGTPSFKVFFITFFHPCS